VADAVVVGERVVPQCVAGVETVRSTSQASGAAPDAVQRLVPAHRAVRAEDDGQLDDDVDEVDRAEARGR
jgi:hypothetical protein